MVLMKFYMYEKEWGKVVECGREVMKCGYLLVINYKDIFILDNEGNDEMIFLCIEIRGVNEQMWYVYVLLSNYFIINLNI